MTSRGGRRPALVDWSAYARVLLARRDPGPRRLSASIVSDFSAALLGRSLFGSAPLRLEALYSAASPADYAAFRRELRAMPEPQPDAGVWEAAEEAQADLAAAPGVSHRVKPIDLVIAAIASRNSLDVLHYDRDYEVIAEHTSLAFEPRWIAPRGSVD